MKKRLRKTTSDQRLYKRGDEFKAEIDICPTDECAGDPSILRCRHAILTIQTVDNNGEITPGYVVYDRLLNRIVNGVFYGDSPDEVLQCAQAYNERADSPQDMAPNGIALNLKYPAKRTPDEE